MHVEYFPYYLGMMYHGEWNKSKGYRMDIELYKNTSIIICPLYLLTHAQTSMVV